MKAAVLILSVFLLTACDEEAARPKDISTVDSTILEPLDTTPATLHLDNMNDTVALDSMGQTINPEDTNYNRR